MKNGQKISAAQGWIIFLLLVQLGGWVWGLSAIASDVENNKESVREVATRVGEHNERLQQHESSIQVMRSQREDTSRRLQRIEAKLDRLIESQD